ncbi:MAG: TatD family hydrolase [Kordiimonadaceae bacterium]|nr:TatD family hydrolase [Kordiimonadaceae bacterium]
MTFIVDSHCHLNYGSLADDMDGVLKRAADAGVGTMLAINARLSEYEDVLKIAKAHDHIWATVGSHPHDAEDEWGIKPEQLIEMAKHEKVVGIGETGLDYFYEHSPRDKQKENFIAHIEASRETGLPLIVHARDADDDCAEIMEAEMKKGEYPAVIHCFTASEEFARRSLDIGCYISLSGIVTFKSARELQEAVKIIPLSRLLIETDAPFLAPVPMRGKPNEPSFVKYTAEFLSHHFDVSFEDLARATTDNFFTLFSKTKRPENS